MRVGVGLAGWVRARACLRMRVRVGLRICGGLNACARADNVHGWAHATKHDMATRLCQGSQILSLNNSTIYYNVAIAVQPHSRVVAWGVRALSVRATCVKGGIGAFIYVDAASVVVNGVAW